jgi:hypothetical protein
MSVPDVAKRIESIPNFTVRVSGIIHLKGLRMASHLCNEKRQCCLHLTNMNCERRKVCLKLKYMHVTNIDGSAR